MLRVWPEAGAHTHAHVALKTRLRPMGTVTPRFDATIRRAAATDTLYLRTGWLGVVGHGAPEYVRLLPLLSFYLYIGWRHHDTTLATATHGSVTTERLSA